VRRVSVIFAFTPEPEKFSLNNKVRMLKNNMAGENSFKKASGLISPWPVSAL